MKILVLALNFPSSKAPLHGVFVKERMRYLAKHCDIRIVNPVPRIPFLNRLKPSIPVGVSRYEIIEGLEVYHPSFFYIPGLFKCLDGLFLFLSCLPVVMQLRRKFRFDLIDAHFAYPDGFAGVLLGKVFRVPVTITLRGTIVSLSKFKLRQRLIRWTLNEATRIFTVAKFLSDIAKNLKVEKSITVISNGIDPNKFYPMSKLIAREKLGLPPKIPIILTVGTLTEHKGHQRIISILPDIINKIGQVLLVIVGGESVAGNYGPNLKQLTEKLNLQKYVHFAGPQPHGLLNYWVNAADVFCLASKCEGCANVLLESLACGVPVVANDVGGNREIITSDELGILVPFGDSSALAQALINGLQKQWDKKKILSYANQYSWEHVAQQLLTQYEEILGFHLTSPNAVSS